MVHFNEVYVSMTSKACPFAFFDAGALMRGDFGNVGRVCSKGDDQSFRFMWSSEHQLCPSIERIG